MSTHNRRGGRRGGDAWTQRGGGGGGGGRGRGRDGGRGRGGRGGRSGYEGGGDRQGGYRGGGRSGSGGGGGGGGRGRGGQAPANINSVISNVILADVSANFKFYLYTVDGKSKNDEVIDSSLRRNFLVIKGISALLAKSGLSRNQVENVMRQVFPSGSFFFTANPIQGLEFDKLPMQILDGTDTEGDVITIVRAQCFSKPAILSTGGAQAKVANDQVDVDLRCSHCPKAFTSLHSMLTHCSEEGHTPVYGQSSSKEDIQAPDEQVFLSYVNIALQRALSERMVRWGRDYINPKIFDTQYGVKIFQAYRSEFDIIRPDVSRPPTLSLTVDLKAKIIRTESLLHMLTKGKDKKNPQFSTSEQNRIKREWVGETVISMIDKSCFSVHDVLFDQSPDSLMIKELNMSHTRYFEVRKKYKLEFPRTRIMIAVLGRKQSIIHLPPETVCGNELDAQLKQKLPMIASFKADKRYAAIEEIRRFLIPGAQKTKGVGGGLLPALGIHLKEASLRLQAQVIPAPVITAAGVAIPRGKAQWGNSLAKATFNIEAKQAVNLNVVLIHHSSIQPDEVYDRLRNNVNRLNGKYRFPRKPFATVPAGDNERHWGAVEKFLGSKVPSNVFFVDFNKPKQGSDLAYSVVKYLLAKGGYLSQFVNFKNCNHEYLRDDKAEKKSTTILGGVARQVLCKCGVAIWWTTVPRSLPVPVMFVGVDVYHAPQGYDPKTKSKTAKASCAAIIVQIVRGNSANIECYTQTFKRGMGEEYNLGEPLEQAVRNAIKNIGVKPKSCVVWRDGLSKTSTESHAKEEIDALRKALRVSSGKGPQVPLAFISCQKRIAVKFIVPKGNQFFGPPTGALVIGLEDVEHRTFYITGTAPPFSMPKPVRFVIVQRDDALNGVSMTDLTWDHCHSYLNWPGPIKVPSVCQLAHKLAEHAGGFSDSGESINHKAFTNKMYFL